MEMRRTAVALDLENLLGGSLSGEALTEITQTLGLIREDHIPVALVGYCARGFQRRLAFELAPWGVRVFGHSDPRPDAADRMVLGYLEHELPSSADTVIIGSGDHIFAPAAAALMAKGLRVEVAARPGSLAASLYRRCAKWYPVGMGDPLVPAGSLAVPAAA
jgi:hypothetical protein